MAGRAMTEGEHRADLRAILKNAAEIAEAFKAMIEDGITLNTSAALGMLEELRGCIDSVYVDLEPVEQNVQLKSWAERTQNILFSE